MAEIYTHRQIDNLCQKLQKIDAKKADELAISFKNGSLTDDFYKECSALVHTPEKKSYFKVNEGSDTSDEEENLPLAENNKDFKKALREIFQPSAEKKQSEYWEDIKAPEYHAEITHKNGSVDKIVAANANSITLSAKDKDGNTKMPNMQRFYDIVAFAKKQGTIIEFGDIKSPDFKARLMLACIEAKPAMQMVGAPKLDDEFLQTIQDEKLKSFLQDMKSKRQKENKVPRSKQNQVNSHRALAQKTPRSSRMDGR